MGTHIHVDYNIKLKPNTPKFIFDFINHLIFDSYASTNIAPTIQDAFKNNPDYKSLFSRSAIVDYHDSELEAPCNFKNHKPITPENNHINFICAWKVYDSDVLINFIRLISSYVENTGEILIGYNLEMSQNYEIIYLNPLLEVKEKTIPESKYDEMIMIQKSFIGLEKEVYKSIPWVTIAIKNAILRVEQQGFPFW